MCIQHGNIFQVLGQYLKDKVQGRNAEINLADRDGAGDLDHDPQDGRHQDEEDLEHETGDDGL